MSEYEKLMGGFEKRFNDIRWMQKYAAAYGSFASIIYGAWSLAGNRDCGLVAEYIEQALENSIKTVERMATEHAEEEE